MPRRRQREENIITAEQVGGTDREAYAVLAVPGEYPEDYENEGPIWKSGYDVAARIGNTTKACVIFANNYQGENLSDAAIEAEIERLRKVQESRAS